MPHRFNRFGNKYSFDDLSLPEQLNINESFICRIWEGAELYLDSVATDDGLPVEIIDFGRPNHDSGPDYKDAKIRIGEKIMAGDVEVHRDFKGWFEHSHKSDSAYNSVILQVVLWDTGKELKPKTTNCAPSATETAAPTAPPAEIPRI